MQYRVMEHAGSLDSTKEVQESSWVLSKLPKCSITRKCTAKSMNQFIRQPMELSIKSDAKNGQQYWKWLFALSEILCKIGTSFILDFLLKERVFYITISKQKNLSLPLKVETDQFVIYLVLPECLSVKICRISPSNSVANRDGADAKSPFPLFFSFSASFKNSSPREKVGNCPCFGTGGWSLCFNPSRKIFPHANNGSLRQKNSGRAICSCNQRAPSRFWACLHILNLTAWLC